MYALTLLSEQHAIKHTIGTSWSSRLFKTEITPVMSMTVSEKGCSLQVFGGIETLDVKGRRVTEVELSHMSDIAPMRSALHSALSETPTPGRPRRPTPAPPPG
jgi:hypothetical protein